MLLVWMNARGGICLHMIYCSVTVNWFVDCLTFIVWYEIILELRKQVKFDFLFLFFLFWTRLDFSGAFYNIEAEFCHALIIFQIFDQHFPHRQLQIYISDTDVTILESCFNAWNMPALLMVAQWHIQHAESALWSTGISTAAAVIHMRPVEVMHPFTRIAAVWWRTDRCF